MTSERAKITEACKAIAAVLHAYLFVANDEAGIQSQVLKALDFKGVKILGSEVIADCGRFDIYVDSLGHRIVLELKVGGQAGAVERQAQRYAMSDRVDAVLIVTTSNRLARQLAGPTPIEMMELGGKPFGVVVLRTF